MQTLNDIHPEAESAGRMAHVIDICLLKALALQELGETATAIGSLDRSLTLAEPEGYIRIFIDAGQAMAQLLAKALSRGITAEYTGRLLEAFSDDHRSVTAIQARGAGDVTSAPQLLVEPLSERELEVLKLIAEGLSNREIAARLVISLSTVKGHTANIFGKLGVHRRTLAAARARELDLL